MANNQRILTALAIISVISMLILSSCSKRPTETPAPVEAPKIEPAAEMPKAPETASAAEPAKPAETPTEPSETPSEPARMETPAKPVKTPTSGRFTLTYEPAKDEYNKEIESFFRGTEYLDNFTSGISDIVALPQDVQITVKECGGADTKYDKDGKKITLCYELAGYFSDILATNESGVPEEDIGSAVMDATVNALIHEMSIAIADLNKISAGKVEQVAGENEEETADKISALLLLQAGPEGRDLAVMSSSVFFINGMLDNDPKIPYWSHRSPDGQRFLNVICWIYGSDPENNKDIVDAGYLPEDNTKGCVEEFKKVADEPGRRLEEYLR